MSRSNQFLFGALTFFDYGHERVQMDGVNIPLKAGWNALFPLDGVYPVRKSAHVGGKVVIQTMNILTQIDPARSHMRQHFLNSGDLLLGKMSAVINQNVN